MTWNPLVHMGPWSLLMFALVGVAWGLMPTDPSRYRSRRRGRFYVAGAGPAMNLLLAFITLTAAAFWTEYGAAREPLHTNIAEFLLTGGWLNLALAIFNLLPVPPLDGANVLAGLSFRAYVFFQNPQVSMIGMLILMVLLFSGVGSVVFFGLPRIAAVLYVQLIQDLLPGPDGA
jgi:Zn-dependent protease